MLGLVVDAHGPAHRDDGIPLPIRQRLALVELDARQLVRALAQDVLEHARRLAGDVLEDENPHQTPAGAPAPSRAASRRSTCQATRTSSSVVAALPMARRRTCLSFSRVCER